MSNKTETAARLPTGMKPKISKDNRMWRSIWKYKALYLISIPSILYFLIFKYIPLGGSVIAFQEYNIFKGFSGSEWVGFAHFAEMFRHYDFLRILKNTVLIGLYDLIEYVFL
jgi:putative aldouronate transport system permease protein